jgi:acyl-CoA reductase-like NAD-dependent aldehyde dehydrogenase
MRCKRDTNSSNPYKIIMSTLEVVNPFDQKAIGSVDLVPWNSIDSWLEDAHRLSRDRRQWLPVHQRIAILKTCAKLMSERAAHWSMVVLRPLSSIAVLTAA